MNKPNIKFVARSAAKGPSPIESFSYKGEVVALPAAAEQRAKPFFFHERADLIVRQYPFLYKRVQKKGRR